MIVRKQYTKGGALGSYLHAHWQNYQDYGISSSLSKEQQDERDNEEAIERFYNSIRTRNSALRTFQQNDLWSLENSYNERRSELMKQIFQLKDEEANEANAFLLKVLQNADLGKDVDLSLVSKFLERDEKIDSIKLNLNKNTVENVKRIYAPHGKHEAFVSTINGHFKTLETILNEIDKEAAELKDILFTKYEKVKKEWDIVVKNLNNVQAITDRINSNVKFYKNLNTQTLKDNAKFFSPAGGTQNAGKIPTSLGQFFTKKIRNITSSALTANQIAKIQGSLEEVLGAYLYGPARSLAIDELTKELKNISKLSIPGTDKTSMGLDLNATIQMDTSLMQEFYESEINRSKGFQTIEAYTLADGKTRYRFVVDYLTKDKVDFYMDFEGAQVGVSSKAVQLDKQWEDGAHQIPAGIHIQSGTSLYIYLLAFQRMQAGIGNHFLNIFSTHEDGDFSNTPLRQLANKALLSALLYSALTGDITKPNSDLAQILYIYDKSKSIQGRKNISRVHFISIQDLVTDIIEQEYNEMKQIVRVGNIPIDQIQLANSMISKGERLSAEAQRAVILQRITHAINSTRRIKFDIAINNAYFKEKFH